jgi:DNA-binding NtrC family response regulator
VPRAPVAVLVVEDDILLRMSIVQELGDAGFDVFEAENASAAIELLNNNNRIQVMFSDVDMPGGIDGLKLAALVRDRWPPIKIIITSGHHDLSKLVMPEIEIFLPKPYTPERVVASILEIAEG